jgi:hypothetical protein
MKVKQEPTYNPITITLETEKEAVNLMRFLECFSLTNMREIKELFYPHCPEFDADECCKVTDAICHELFEMLPEHDLWEYVDELEKYHLKLRRVKED